MPAGVSRPLPTLMLVMLSFSASRLAKRLSGAGVKICMVSKLAQSRPMPVPMHMYTECLAHHLSFTHKNRTGSIIPKRMDCPPRRGASNPSMTAMWQSPP